MVYTSQCCSQWDLFDKLLDHGLGRRPVERRAKLGEGVPENATTLIVHNFNSESFSKIAHTTSCS